MLKRSVKVWESNGYAFYCEPVMLAFVKANANCASLKEWAKDRGFYYENACSNDPYFADIVDYRKRLCDGNFISYKSIDAVRIKDGEGFSLDVSRWSYEDGATNPITPDNSGKRQVKDFVREAMYSELRSALGEDFKDDCLFLNIWRYAIKNVELPDVWCLTDEIIENKDNAWVKRELSPKPAKAAPKSAAAAPQNVQVIERIIERPVEKVTPLEDMLQRAVCEMVAKTTVEDMVPRIKARLIDEFGFEPIRHEIKIADKPAIELNKITHKMFGKVLFFVANNTPIYLYGPAGSGKNHMVEQIAEAMKLDFYTLNSVTEEFKFNGFMDVNGKYQESEFYKAFTKGGIFFLDEIDASCPEVLVNLNAAIANGYFPFPCGTKKAHENFRVIAAGNTLGTGADASYTGRTQLDAATLNRFVVIPVDYDERIDLLSANGDEELANFAKGYRIAAKKCGLATVCSYRNIKMIKTAEAAMSIEDALLYSLTKEMNKDDINTIIGQFPFDYRNNKYYNALSKIQPMC